MKITIAIVAVGLMLSLGGCKPSTAGNHAQPHKAEAVKAANTVNPEADPAAGPAEGVAKEEPAEGAAVAPAPGAISDAQIGLTKGSVFDDPEPPLWVQNTVTTDDAEGQPAAFKGAPPNIPHSLEGLLPITLDHHPCLECHEDSFPESHLTDLRNAPGTVGKKLVGARYVCNSCHAAPTVAAPIVSNVF